MSTRRRDFLKDSLGAAAATLVGPPSWAHREPSAELQGTVPFAGEGEFPLDVVVGSGLSGRRAVDLSRLGPESLITPSERFFIRTLYPDRLHVEGAWKIRIRGLVEAPLDIDLTELLREARPMGAHVLECAGNSRRVHFGLMSAAEWAGIPLRAVLERSRVHRGATRILISGFDEHSRVPPDSRLGASWVFTFDDLERAGAFLATEMNGAPLSRDHGSPVRLMVPGWYGCVCVKWVNEIRVVDDSAPATDQMREFANRTEQDALTPRLASDYRPATVDLAVLPVRVERWSESGKSVYRVVGLLWGGEQRVKRLLIRFGPDEPYVPVDDFQHRTLSTWNLWSHRWRPRGPGRYRIDLRVDQPGVRTRRLDRGFYARAVELT